MSLTKKQIDQLNKIIATVKKVIATAEAEPKHSGKQKRMRRSSADAKKMKVEIKAARAKGVSATKLAEKFGVSTAYIYMMK